MKDIRGFIRVILEISNRGGKITQWKKEGWTILDDQPPYYGSRSPNSHLEKISICK